MALTLVQVEELRARLLLVIVAEVLVGLSQVQRGLDCAHSVACGYYEQQL